MKSALLYTAALHLVWVLGRSLDDCPGYELPLPPSDVPSWLLTGDLQISGTPCNAYGVDVENLTLIVEYETGLFARLEH